MSGTASHQMAVLGAIGSKTVTLDALAADLPISAKKLATAAGKLVARDYVERLEAGVYRLTLTGREALEEGVTLSSGPHRGRSKHPVFADTLQQRAWKAMRLAGRFTIGDIVALAATERDKTPEGSLQRFFLRLRRAGYLVELPTRVKGTAETSNGFKQWRLVRDTGDHAPRYLEASDSFRDWNTQEVFPCV